MLACRQEDTPRSFVAEAEKWKSYPWSIELVMQPNIKTRKLSNCVTIYAREQNDRIIGLNWQLPNNRPSHGHVNALSERKE